MILHFLSKSNSTIIRLFITILFSMSTYGLYAQCMMHPITLKERIDNAQTIVLGKLKEKHSYWDAEHKNIYTLNILEVKAYLKGVRNHTEIAVISDGGVVENEAQITYPSVQLEDYNEYILFLMHDNNQIDNKAIRKDKPNLIQAQLYADAQGAITKQFGKYHDLYSEPVMNEKELFTKIESHTQEAVKYPDGKIFEPREEEDKITAQQKVQMPIVGFSPNPTNGGTIVVGEFLSITGSGFGAGAGTVFYTNADDGGATFTSSGIASDNTAWADGAITNKVAQNAGTGPINVNGAMTSGSNLTINYGHTAINSNFSGFASTTRQRYYHRNMNGAGGYYFLYNTTSGFSGNSAAVAAFERALQTWRCAIFINFFSNGTTATGFAADVTNVVLFDGTLPAGVLGRATSRFQGSGGGACTLANTVWCVNEIDVQFKPDPPSAGFPWEYGPAAPAFSEYDFESVAVHELGHAVGLQHRIAAGQVMNFAISNGSSVRTLAANEIAGGNARMTYSSAATCSNPAACGTGPMTLLNSSTCLLPVELISFTGKYKKETSENLLNWITASEINNDFFVVEKSINGVDFESIGTVKSKKSNNSDYQFSDRNIQEGIAYYRLKQIDKDGDFAYSGTIAVTVNSKKAFSVAPNPANEDVSVSFSNLPEHESIVNIYDSKGQIIFTTRTLSTTLTIETTQFAPGIYMLSVTNEHGITNTKFIKK